MIKPSCGVCRTLLSISAAHLTYPVELCGIGAALARRFPCIAVTNRLLVYLSESALMSIVSARPESCTFVDANTTATFIGLQDGAVIMRSQAILYSAHQLKQKYQSLDIIILALSKKQTLLKLLTRLPGTGIGKAIRFRSRYYYGDKQHDAIHCSAKRPY